VLHRVTYDGNSVEPDEKGFASVLSSHGVSPGYHHMSFSARISEKRLSNHVNASSGAMRDIWKHRKLEKSAHDALHVSEGVTNNVGTLNGY